MTLLALEGVIGIENTEVVGTCFGKIRSYLPLVGEGGVTADIMGGSG